MEKSLVELKKHHKALTQPKFIILYVFKRSLVIDTTGYKA